MNRHTRFTITKLLIVQNAIDKKTDINGLMFIGYDQAEWRMQQFFVVIKVNYSLSH